MTYEQYWYGDVWMARAFFEADKKRQERFNDEAWWLGAYVYNAVSAALSVSEFFRGKNQKPKTYLKEPVAINTDSKKQKKRKQEQEDADAVFAKAYMMNMERMGKNWGKNKM